MRESELLRHIAERSPVRALGPGVVVGPGDDCAVLAPSGRDLLVTVDHLVEGRHFAPHPGTPIDAIARKAVARSVSDIAAMAGTPAWGLATGALPPEWMAGGRAGADELFDRMAHWARHWHCPLVGGDISSLPGGAGSPLVLTVTVAGHVHATRGAVLRSGACAGDAVWMTGRIGGSLKSGRHLTFEPRVAEGRWLADTLGEDLHAMIDVSDGLGRDAGRIAAASGVRVEIERARVPLHGDAGATALADGEDYELVFTTAAGVELPPACPLTGVALTRIGRVATGGGCGIIEPDGCVVEGADLGWDH
ncbi:MAG: thiamine-phosphate kinase [Phycisphaerales bacterium]